MRIRFGFILPYVMMVLAVLVLLLYALGSTGIQALNRSVQIKNGTAACFAAEAGVETALYAIETNPSSITYNKGTVSFEKIPFFFKQDVGESLEQKDGSFTVTVTNNSGFSEIFSNSMNSKVSQVAAPDGTIVPLGRIYISSEGEAFGAVRHSNAMVELLYAWNFPYALFAKDELSISQALSTDSYYYERTDNDENIFGRNKGDVGINFPQSDPPSMRFGGTSSFNGTIYLGTSGNPDTLEHNSSFGCMKQKDCRGAISSLIKTQAYPDIINPIGPPNYANNLNIQGQTTEISPSSYGNVQVGLGGQLTFNCTTTAPVAPGSSSSSSSAGTSSSASSKSTSSGSGGGTPTSSSSSSGTSSGSSAASSTAGTSAGTSSKSPSSSASPSPSSSASPSPSSSASPSPSSSASPSPSSSASPNSSSSSIASFMANYYSIGSLSVSLSGNIGVDSSCTDSNPVILFVYDKLDIPSVNMIINYSYDAGRFIILGMPSLKQVRITGGPNAAFALYAPEATIDLSSGGDIYGSVIGKKITSSGLYPLSLHFEEDLLDIPAIHVGDRYDVKIDYWTSDY